MLDDSPVWMSSAVGRKQQGCDYGVRILADAVYKMYWKLVRGIFKESVPTNV